MRKSEIRSKLKRFGLRTGSIEKTKSGTSRRVFIIKSDNERYVLKTYPKSRKKRLENKLSYLRKISKNSDISITPSEIINFSDCIAYFYSYIEGKHYSNSRVKNKNYQFGKLVGKFSKESAPLLKFQPRGEYMLGDIDSTYEYADNLGRSKDEYLQAISGILLEALAIFEENYKCEKYPVQLCHGDIHQDNVIYNKGKSTIFDCDGLALRFRVSEIVVIISYSLSKSDKINKQILNLLVSGFESEQKLTKAEKEFIPLLLLVRKFGEIMYLLNQHNTKVLNEKDFNFFINHSLQSLDLIIRKFDSLMRICRKL